MIVRIPRGALWRRAGFVAIVMVLAGGLYLLGDCGVALAAAPQAPASSDVPSVDTAFKNAHPPRYPLDAIRKGEQGEVMLDVTVDASGRVVDMAVDLRGTTAPEPLQAAAMSAAREWKFNPGHKNGKPVGGIVKIPVTFALHALTAAATAPVMLKIYIDSHGDVTDAVIDQAHSTENSPQEQAEAIEAIKKVKFGGVQPGWHDFPYVPPIGMAPSSSGWHVESRSENDYRMAVPATNG